MLIQLLDGGHMGFCA